MNVSNIAPDKQDSGFSGVFSGFSLEQRLLEVVK